LPVLFFSFLTFEFFCSGALPVSSSYSRFPPLQLCPLFSISMLHVTLFHYLFTQCSPLLSFLLLCPRIIFVSAFSILARSSRASALTLLSPPPDIITPNSLLLSHLKTNFPFFPAFQTRLSSPQPPVCHYLFNSIFCMSPASLSPLTCDPELLSCVPPREAASTAFPRQNACFLASICSVHVSSVNVCDLDRKRPES